MKKHKRNSKPDPGWLQIADFTEEKLRVARLRAAQLEALAGVFRGMAATGDACPAELLQSVLAENQSKQA